MKRRYEQSYRVEWEKNPLFSSWLSKCREDNNSAFCKACNSKILPRIASIKEHSNSAKHIKNMIGFSGSSQIDQYFKKTSVENEVRKAEMKVVACLVEHNVPFRIMDHLSAIINQAFHDSEIAKKFSCKRTKSAAIAYNALGKQFEEKMHEDLKSGLATFSIIIDESTDISTTKVLAIAIKYFSKNSHRVNTKLLSIVDIQGETAQDLLNALKTVFDERGLKWDNMIGFAADTTNVMFGENAGIVAKMKELNPHCVYVKCVCHSVALAVSHACKLLPRKLEQLVKEVYNYFAQSSKRQREFMEFQDFTESEHYKLLRHYDIRWLSLHGCIARILQQWPALKLYFQGQYLGEKNSNASAEFLFNSFNDETVKLYLYFLDYILPFTNKFNTIFQGDYPVVHRLYNDMRDFFVIVLNCYMKTQYVKSTPIQNIDPNSSVNYLPLNNLYLGVNFAKHLDSKRSQIPQQHVQDIFKRCQDFLIDLCVQLKKRLPVNNDIFQELTFLNPQTAVHAEFTSLSNVASKFPNFVSESDVQLIDNEFRELKLDRDVNNLLCSTSSNEAITDVDVFWESSSKLYSSDNQPKYANISKFAKHMLCLPVSNAKCERIFSQMNRIKTVDRNRFHNKNLCAILHAKEGLKEAGNCSKFQPDTDMTKVMEQNKILYKNINQNADSDDNVE